MRKKIIILLAATFLMEINAASQNVKKWSLQDCIDYALKNNIQLQKNKVSEVEATTDLKQAKAALLPSVSASMTQSVSHRPFQKSSSNFVNGSITTSSSNKTTQSGSYGINASWTVWNGGVNTNTIKSKELSEDMARLQTEVQANSIQEQIAQLYIQILYSEDAVKFDEELLKSDSIELNRGKEMLKAQKMSRSDVAQLEAAVNEGIYTVVNAKTQVNDYKVQLKQLLELQPEDEIDVEDLNTSEDAALSTIPGKLSIYYAALANRPEIKNSETNIKASDLQLKIAKAGYMPNVSLTAGIGDNHMTGFGEDFGNQMKYNLSGSIGVTLSFPILDNRQTKSATEKAKYNRLNATLDLADQQKELFSTIEKYWLNATNNQQRYIAATSNVKSRKESFNLIDEQFRLGLKNIIELTSSRTSLLQATQEMLESKYTTLLNLQLLKFDREKL